MFRTKIILIIAVSILMLSSGLYIVSTTMLLNSYEDIENELLERNLTRVDQTIQNYRDTLNIKLRDWAQWDDSYQFMQDHNTTYTESNLAATTLINLEINLIAFVDSQKQILFSKFINLTTQEELPSDTLMAALLNHPDLFAPGDINARQSGILNLPTGILFVEALPIRPTNGIGPQVGTIIFARYLDDERLENFEEITQLRIDIAPYDSDAHTDDIFLAKEKIDMGDSFFIHPLSKEIIAGYFVLKDQYSAPISIVKVESTREIYAQGNETVRIFTLIASGSILVFGLVIYILFEKLLLSRFNRLSKDVEKISFSNLADATVYSDKDDEVGRLANKINDMLTKLGELQEREQDALLKEKEANENLRTNLEKTEKINKLMVDREIKMTELKKEILELKASSEKST